MCNRPTVSSLALFCIVTACVLSGRLLSADDGPEVLRIDSVVMSVPQPQASDEAVIWSGYRPNVRLESVASGDQDRMSEPQALASGFDTPA
jgi:hypothetical protein